MTGSTAAKHLAACADRPRPSSAIAPCRSAQQGRPTTEANIVRAGDHAIHQLSSELMFLADELPPEIVKPITSIMHKVPIGNLGTIRNIGAAAGNLAGKNRLDEALALITPLISAHEELTSLDPLGSVNYSLLQLPPDQLARTIMGWLLACDSNLGRATMALVGDHHGHAPLILDPRSAAASLDDPKRLLLAHRATGWLFVYPVTAASLVVGLLDGAGNTSIDAAMSRPIPSLSKLAPTQGPEAPQKTGRCPPPENQKMSGPLRHGQLARPARGLVSEILLPSRS